MAGAADPLRVALVGASARRKGWGPAAHLPAINAVAGLELVALGTSSPTSAAAAAETYGIPRAYHDVHELAAQPDIDLVTVAVRVPHHHAIVMPLLEAGKHVYCEWPLGATTAQAEEMAAAARAHGVVAVVGLQGHHDAALTHLKRLVEDAWLGEVLTVRVTMIGGGALDHRADDAWMADDAHGANTVTIVGGHVLDQVEHLFGRLAEVSASVGVQVPQWRLADTDETVTADAPDHVLLHGTLAGGGLLSLHVASVPHHGPGWTMEAYGTRGTLRATSAGLPQIAPIALHGALGDDPLSPLEVPATAGGPAVPAGPAANIARSYVRMAEAVRAGSPAEPDFDHAVRVHRLLDAARRSSDAGARIGVDA